MTAASPKPGRVVIFSGPSGVGKTTVVRRVFEVCSLPLVASVSATTRQPRPGEVEGRNYYFLSPEEFARRRAADEFLECCEVFGRGDWYGTLLSEVAPRLASGKWVVLEIDVEGAAKVVRRFPDAITIFIEPESLDELRRRLEGRATESAEVVARRLDVARRELTAADRYRFRVVNDQVDRAVDEICAILAREATP